MVLSTAIPTLIAATVIVIMSNGIFSNPKRPITEEATKIFGTNPIIIIFNDLKINKSMKPMTLNTKSKDAICD